jgi:hypothetical protein
LWLHRLLLLLLRLIRLRLPCCCIVCCIVRLHRRLLHPLLLHRYAFDSLRLRRWLRRLLLLLLAFASAVGAWLHRLLLLWRLLRLHRALLHRLLLLLWLPLHLLCLLHHLPRCFAHRLCCIICWLLSYCIPPHLLFVVASSSRFAADSACILYSRRLLRLFRLRLPLWLHQLLLLLLHLLRLHRRVCRIRRCCYYCV